MSALQVQPEIITLEQYENLPEDIRAEVFFEPDLLYGQPITRASDDSHRTACRYSFLSQEKRRQLPGVPSSI